MSDQPPDRRSRRVLPMVLWVLSLRTSPRRAHDQRRPVGRSARAHFDEVGVDRLLLRTRSRRVEMVSRVVSWVQRSICTSPGRTRLVYEEQSDSAVRRGNTALRAYGSVHPRPQGPPVHRRGQQLVGRPRLAEGVKDSVAEVRMGCGRHTWRVLRRPRLRRSVLSSAGDGGRRREILPTSGRAYGGGRPVGEARRDARDWPPGHGVWEGPLQLTACPTAREGAGAKRSLTCRNTYLHQDLVIWHPAPSIAHPVFKSGAGSSQSRSTHAVRTVTTVAGTGQIDVTFISRRYFRAGGRNYGSMSDSATRPGGGLHELRAHVR